MDVNVMLLNVLDWEKGDKKGSTIVYLITGKDFFENSDKFLGYHSITNFYNDHIRSRIPEKAIGNVLKAKLSNKRSLKDPSVIYSKLESIDFNGEVISLL